MSGQPMQVYEVFRREREGGPMQHAGNLLAPDPELASHYAREFYGRRPKASSSGSPPSRSASSW